MIPRRGRNARLPIPVRWGGGDGEEGEGGVGERGLERKMRGGEKRQREGGRLERSRCLLDDSWVEILHLFLL